MTNRDQARQVHVGERKTGLQPTPSAAGTSSEASRLCLIGVEVDTALRREIDAYAEANGVSRSRAAGHFLSIGREAIHERDGVPGSRADELLDAVDGLRGALDILGPPTFGMLRLLARWVAQSGGVKVSEDELLAELRPSALHCAPRGGPARRPAPRAVRDRPRASSPPGPRSNLTP
jgi:hypothetical protein